MKDPFVKRDTPYMRFYTGAHEGGRAQGRQGRTGRGGKKSQGSALTACHCGRHAGRDVKRRIEKI